MNYFIKNEKLLENNESDLENTENSFTNYDKLILE